MNCPECNIDASDYTRGCNGCDDRARAAYQAANERFFSDLDEAVARDATAYSSDPRSAPWNLRNLILGLVSIACIYGLGWWGLRLIWAWATGLHT